MANIQDVARKSGVSSSTVSIILNHREEERKIPETTVKRVRKVIRELHYHPSRTARSLRNQTSRICIALVWVLDRRSNLFMRVVRGVEQSLLLEGHPGELIIHPYRNGKIEEVFYLLEEGYYDGILIGALTPEDQEKLEKMEVQCPICLINRASQRFLSCRTDAAQIGRTAAEYALARDCHTLVMVRSDAATAPRLAREQAIQEACEAAGIRVLKQIQVSGGISGGLEAAKRMDAVSDLVFLEDDLMAAGFSAGCKGKPRILTIGLNEPDLGAHLPVPIDVIEIPGEEMGKRSGRLLRDAILGTGTQREVICNAVLHRT